MKQFFKFLLASMFGFFISIFLICLFLFFMVFSTISNLDKSKVTTIKPNSVLHLKFDYVIPERTSPEPLEVTSWFNFDFKKTLGLNDILKNIKKAKSDDNVKGIYLDLNSVYARFATIEEIRNALIDFKTSKKFIYAYGEVVGQRAYYLGSIADKVFLNREGFLEFKGLATELAFFKSTLDKLGIEAQVFPHGKYKSAIEPLIYEKMTEPSREQINSILESTYNHFLKGISQSRKLDLIVLDSLADNLIIRNANSALKYALVDELIYEDELHDYINEKLGFENDNKVNLINLSKYDNVAPEEKNYQKEKIALVYALGNIHRGKSNNDDMGSSTMIEAIRAARIDKNVKAVVIRINSPGGDAIASDIIWREVALTKKDKPVVVSMGDVAASGGYYMACAADTIVAQPNTITGSIGVFGVILNTESFWKDNIGVTFDRVKKGDFSDFPSATRPLTTIEKTYIQQTIDSMYHTFVTKVADGRKQSWENIDAIAQGRVWTGEEAKEKGLVDVIGGIDNALDIAAQMAELTDYQVVEFPKEKNSFEEIIEYLTGQTKTKLLKNELGIYYNYFHQLQSILEMSKYQARIPYEIYIH